MSHCPLFPRLQIPSASHPTACCRVVFFCASRRDGIGPPNLSLSGSTATVLRAVACQSPSSDDGRYTLDVTIVQTSFSRTPFAQMKRRASQSTTPDSTGVGHPGPKFLVYSPALVQTVFTHAIGNYAGREWNSWARDPFCQLHAPAAAAIGFCSVHKRTNGTCPAARPFQFGSYRPPVAGKRARFFRKYPAGRSSFLNCLALSASRAAYLFCQFFSLVRLQLEPHCSLVQCALAEPMLLPLKRTGFLTFLIGATFFRSLSTGKSRQL